MSILSNIKSFLSKLLSRKYLLNSLSNEPADVINLTGNLTIHINNISIEITSNNDVTITGVRFFDIKSDTLFINSDESDKLKQLKLKDPKALEEKFKMNTSRLKSLKDKYETSL